MKKTTCAACDSDLDRSAIEVTIGGHIIEACCDDCAQRLKEAHASARRDPEPVKPRPSR